MRPSVRYQLLPALLAILVASPVFVQDGGASDQATVQMLTREVDRLLDEARQMRGELARVRLENDQMARELEELQAFVRDHSLYGADFEKYTAFIELKERQARLERQRLLQEQRERDRAVRQERARATQAERRLAEAESVKLQQYADQGFTPIGLDVFTSRMSFNYRSNDATRTRIGWDPIFGRTLRTYTEEEIDFTSMTISGSVLNADAVIRHVGVAIVFFDDDGNQVGNEIVQIDNARPDVPYPFTATVEMATNRPFDSSSVYVLYADDPAPPGP